MRKLLISLKIWFCGGEGQADLREEMLAHQKLRVHFEVNRG